MSYSGYSNKSQADLQAAIDGVNQHIADREETDDNLSASVNTSASNDTKIRIILLQLLSWHNGGATPNFGTLLSQASSINATYGTPNIVDTTDLPDL